MTRKWTLSIELGTRQSTFEDTCRRGLYLPYLLCNSTIQENRTYQAPPVTFFNLSLYSTRRRIFLYTFCSIQVQITSPIKGLINSIFPRESSLHLQILVIKIKDYYYNIYKYFFLIIYFSHNF